MAYTAWSVVYGEQPTAAKWNQLGTNDAGFKDGTNIDAGAIGTTHLADGAVTDVKRALLYAFHAYHTAAQNGGNAAFAKTSFTTEEFDVGSNYASSRFTAPINGYYHFAARTGGSSTSRCIISLFKNGTEKLRGNDNTTATALNASFVSGYIKLAAGDYVEAWTYTANGSALAVVAGETYFQGYCVAKY